MWKDKLIKNVSQREFGENFECDKFIAKHV